MAIGQTDLDEAARTLALIIDRYRQNQEEQRQRVIAEQPELVAHAFDFSRPLPPEWEDDIHEARRNPVRFALRAAAREIGWSLYAQGGRDAMEKAMDCLDDMTPGRPGGAILDKWWNGIAGWIA